MIWPIPQPRTDSALASNLLITCSLDLEAAMTRWIRPGTVCCVLSALCFAALGGCGSGTSVPKVNTAKSSAQRIANPQVPAADSTTLASDNAAFAFAAYQQLITANTNLVFSPASISIALAMTYAGAATTTATEMASALQFTLLIA